ncbi:MAG: toxin-antitoxin system YwqK family antitoxin, partial [Bacteroidales bacterium]|nr:toxin-antitoxin system YwqK family antitoxin [Bacteroidales bacterium]
MKRVVFAFLLSIFCIVATAQKKITITYPDGNKMAKGTVIQTDTGEAETGKWVFWYHNGTKKTTGSFEKGIKTGVWKSWYPKGALKSEINYSDGPYKVWNEDGSLMVEAYMVDGKFHGPYTSWHSNRNILTEGAYRNGEKHGKWSIYTNKGKLISEGVYDNGKQTGLWREWHFNGKKKSEIHYDTGPFLKWYDNSKKEIEATI